MKPIWPVLLLLVSIVDGSHFRGGVIMVRPKQGGQHNEMLITFHISWRRSSGSGGRCNEDTISSNRLIGGGNLVCLSGCSGTVSNMRYQCTDYSTKEDWSYGQREITYTFPNTTQPNVKIGFIGSAWISPFGGSWYLSTNFNLLSREDTGRPNSSPRAITAPVVRLQSGCQHTVKIAVSDPDGDDVRCRFATTDCGSICNRWPGAIVDPVKCVINFDATSASPGYRAAALVLEDYPRDNTANITGPLSSVSLQFLVLVYQSQGPCSTLPEFIAPTYHQGACIAIPPEETLNTLLLASTGGVGVDLIEIQTVSPPGLRKSQVLNVAGENFGYVNITWTPSQEQQNQTYLFCFTATNSAGSSSEQQCVTFVVGEHPPMLVINAPKGVKVNPYNQTWTFTFDQKIVLANRSAYINFHEVEPVPHQVYKIDVSKPDEIMLINDNTFHITPKHTFAEKQNFFITLDRGIVKGTTNCGPENKAITDENFWTFVTQDLTPPTVYFKPLLSSSVRGNITIEWQIDEEVNHTLASLMHNGQITGQGKPQGIWNATGLEEGEYTFTVTAVDLEGNVGKNSISFKSDLTPPDIELHIPFSGNYTNMADFTIRFSCNEPGCTFNCIYPYKPEHSVQSLSSSPCPGSFRFRDQKNEQTYAFVVQAADRAGNMAEKMFSWTVDLEPPTIMPVPDIHTSCMAGDLSPQMRDTPLVLDNLDLSPTVIHNDLKSSCSIKRVWTAMDKAGNSAEIKQDIYLSYKLDISYLPAVDLQCDSASGLVPISSRTANVSNPCARPITLTYMDDVTLPTCPGIVTRTWTAKDGCSEPDNDDSSEVSEADNLHIVVQTIRLYDLCPITACGRGESPPHGICSQGICKCNKPWYGNNCQTLINEPVIANVSDIVIKEGAGFSFKPELIQGTAPITWSQASELKYMKIDPQTGEMILRRSTAGFHEIKVKAENSVGTNEVVFQLVVKKGYTVQLFPPLQDKFGKASPVHLKGSVDFHDENVIGSLLNYIVPVTIDIFHNNVRRTLHTFTNQATFSVVFHPLPYEYGIFNASARHPSSQADGNDLQIGWTVSGMRTIPEIVMLTGETENEFQQVFMNVAQLLNDGPHHLKVLPALSRLPAKPKVEIFLNQSVDRLNMDKGQTASISIKVTSDKGFRSSFPLFFEAMDGAICVLQVSINILQVLPTFVVTPSRVDTSVSRGMQRIMSFNITNNGRATANNVKLIVPESNLITLLSTGYVGRSKRLVTGELLQPSVLIQIPLGQPLGEITGHFLITSAEATKNIPYRIVVSSDNILDLVVKVEDEFSYFAEGKPLVSDATVQLSNRNRKILITKSTAESNGTVIFMNLNEDRYELSVSAPKHKNYRAVIIATPDKPTLTVFLERTAIEYTWTVTPTKVVDTYEITLEADFEAQIPMPVVTATPASFDLEEIELGYIDTLEINITNHGLIRAENIEFTLPNNHPFLEFSLTTLSIDHLDAQTSVIVPIKVSRKLREKRYVWIIYAIKIGYSFICGDWKFRSIPVVLRKRMYTPPTITGPRGSYNPWGGFGFDLPGFNINGYSASTPVFCNDCLGAFLGCIPGPKFPLAGCIPKLASGPPKVESIKDVLDWIDCAIPIEFGLPTRDKKTGKWKVGKNKFKWSPVSCVLDLYQKCLQDDEDSSSGAKRKKREVKGEIIKNFVKSYQALHYSVEIASEILGGGLWLKVSDNKWVTEVVKPTVDDLSEGGSLITKAEYQQITSHSAPNGTTIEDVKDLINRLNNTIEGWSGGRLEPSGNGQDNMASFSYINDLSQKVQSYDEEVRKKGYDSYLDAYNDANVKVKQIENIEEEAGVCAVVRVRIEQELTLTREGFIAKLEIKNGDNSALSDLNVEIYVTSKETGEESTHLFSIGNATYKGGVNVERILQPGQEGSIEWLLIPNTEAAPMEMVLYDVGGTLSYELEEKEVEIPLLPAQIKVSPDPRLIVHYFWEKFVISDDPFTDEVEEAVPFTLGVAVGNVGYGTAYDLKIASAQPEIIENEKGLKVSFKIIGSTIGNERAKPSLTVDLGDIGPMSTRIARWWLTSSLRGQFSNYSASFENKNPLGDPKLSLIDSLEIHELIRNVKMTGEGEDDILDFLVNDNIEINVNPDALYSSLDLSRQNVSLGKVLSFNMVSTGGNQTWMIETMSNYSGWNYFRFETPVPSGTKLAIYSYVEIPQENEAIMKPIENCWITARNGDKKSDNLIIHLFGIFSHSKESKLYHIGVCSDNCKSYFPDTGTDIPEIEEASTSTSADPTEMKSTSTSAEPTMKSTSMSTTMESASHGNTLKSHIVTFSMILLLTALWQRWF